MRRSRRAWISAFATVSLLGCVGSASREPAPVVHRGGGAHASAEPRAACATEPPAAYRPDAAKQERDTIFLLLALTIASTDYQRSWAGSRGRNVAAVLVDEAGAPVCWARNTNMVTGDLTQHAELRTLSRFFTHTDVGDLRRYTLYSTLEPCAMCAGATAVAKVGLVVYAETPFSSGAVYERLGHDAHEEGGPCPYYSVPMSGAWHHPLADRLAAASRAMPDPSEWEHSPARRAIFADASAMLTELVVHHAENQAALDAARRFAALVPEHDPIADTGVACPPPGWSPSDAGP